MRGLALTLTMLIGCAAPPASEPLVLRPFHGSPHAERAGHVRHALRLIDDEGRAEPFALFGRDLTAAGAPALLVGVGAWLAPDEPAVARGVSYLLPRQGPLPVLDTALVLSALAPAGDFWPGSPLRELRFPARRRATLVASELLARQEPDGGFGDPVASAWAVWALRGSVGIEGEWRERAAAHFAALDPADLDPIERIHAAAGHAAARTGRRIPPLAQRRVRRLLAGLPVDGDADLVLARAFDWMMLGWCLDPDHPEFPAREAFRARYEAGAIAARSPAAEVKLVLALEWFGYDAFGASFGYLPGGDLWEPAD